MNSTGVKDGRLVGLVGQKYWGWGYDTVHMIYDKIVNCKTYESFTNSGMDLVHKYNVDVIADMWEKPGLHHYLAAPVRVRDEAYCVVRTAKHPAGVR